MQDVCFCGSGKSFQTCCQTLLSGESTATTAEQLMRSRYCAAVLANESYTLDSWHSTTRPLKKQMSDGKVKWHRLKIKKVINGGVDDNEGEVIFEAIYKVNGQARKHCEHSRFVKENGQWRYLDALELTDD